MGINGGSTQKNGWCDYCPNGWFQPKEDAAAQCEKWSEQRTCAPGVQWGGGSRFSDQSCGGQAPPSLPIPPAVAPSASQNDPRTGSSSGDSDATATDDKPASGAVSVEIVAGLGVGIVGAISVALFFLLKRQRRQHQYKVVTLAERLVAEEKEKEPGRLAQWAAQQEKKDRQAALGWIILQDEITFHKTIGKGAFGEVWAGKWRGNSVAVKNIFVKSASAVSTASRGLGNHSASPAVLSVSSKSSLNNWTPSMASAASLELASTTGMGLLAAQLLANIEINLMMRLRHPRIVTFLGAGEVWYAPKETTASRNGAGTGTSRSFRRFGATPRRRSKRNGVFVVLELLEGGDLRHRIKASKGSPLLFPWSARLQCACDIAEGMAYIHKQGTLHRDLKSLNILMNHEGRCKIGDLGLARKALQGGCFAAGAGLDEDEDEDEELKTAWRGTKQFMAPELFDVRRMEGRRGLSSYGKPADVYSFAVVLFEILTARVPWRDEGLRCAKEIARAVMAGQRPKVARADIEQAPGGYCNLMERCWSQHPEERPTFEECFEILNRMCEDADTMSSADHGLGFQTVSAQVQQLQTKLTVLSSKEKDLSKRRKYADASQVRRERAAVERLLRGAMVAEKSLLRTFDDAV
jgi:serine/threonine protein kinase